MTRKRKTCPDNGQTTSSGEVGASAPKDMFDLEALLAQVSDRLISVGSVPLSPLEPAPVEPVERMQVMVFLLGDLPYGVEVSYITEVVPQPMITYVPGLPDWVMGVTNLRGNIMSVVHLSRFLEIDALMVKTPLYMLASRAADQHIGLAIDDVKRIFTFPVDQVISPPFRMDSGLVAYLRGAVDHEGGFIRLLDCERLLLGPHMQQFS